MPLVIVYCLAFNHEKYISKTIEGFISQKTTFNFLCIIHDDASTDNTAKIIKEYEERYPYIIHGIYQKENQYSKGVPIIKDYILPLVNSKYVAICEGDDFWEDESKLQKQYDILENNKNCFMCVHRTKELYENGTFNNNFYPNYDLPEGIIDKKKTILDGYLFHTSSYFFEACKWKSYIMNLPDFAKNCGVGDIPYILYFINVGEIYYLPIVMSCYRRGVPGSWSVKMNNTNLELLCENVMQHSKRLYKMFKLFDIYSGFKYNDVCLKKQSVFYLQQCTLSCHMSNFFTKQNFKLFMALDIKKKIFCVLALSFPNYMRTWYLKRIFRLNKERMGI